MNLPYVVMSTNLGGVPNIEDVPWADLDSRLNTTGEVLAPGYAIDLSSGGFAGLTFTAQTYPGLNALLAQYPHLLDDFEGDEIAFRFHILASATPLTRDEFISQQIESAQQLRMAILDDEHAPLALVVLAADESLWDSIYLSALEQAGLLRPEDQTPQIREEAFTISSIATLASGILAGLAGDPPAGLTARPARPSNTTSPAAWWLPAVSESGSFQVISGGRECGHQQGDEGQASQSLGFHSFVQLRVSAGAEPKR